MVHMEVLASRVLGRAHNEGNDRASDDGDGQCHQQGDDLEEELRAGR